MIFLKEKEKVDHLDKTVLEACGDISSELVSQAHGYSGRLFQTSARLFWHVAGIEEKTADYIELEALEEKLNQLSQKLEKI